MRYLFPTPFLPIKPYLLLANNLKVVLSNNVVPIYNIKNVYIL